MMVVNKPPVNILPMGRPAPYSQEAEEAVLGGVLINPLAYVAAAQCVDVESFYILRHQYVWEAFKALFDAGEPIDYLTVQEKLRTMNRLNDVGGPAYLTQLINTVPTTQHVEVYAQLVKRAAVRRRLLVASDEIKALALDEELALEQVLGDASDRLNRASNGHRQASRTWKQVVMEVWDTLDYQIEHPNDTGILLPSGFQALDTVTNGIEKGEQVVIAGRPGMGKSALLQNLVLYWGRTLGLRVAFWTKEMTAEQWVRRMVAIDGSIRATALRTGQLNAQERAIFPKVMERMISGFKYEPVILDGRMTPKELELRAKTVLDQQGLDVLLVDYLQILDLGDGGEESRSRAVGAASELLKDIARLNNIRVVTAAQLSRRVEERRDKRPQLSDLRDSGEIEQNADQVWFLYRDVLYDEATEFPNRCDVLVAKHRAGKTGAVSLHYDAEHTRFSDAATRTINLGAL